MCGQPIVDEALAAAVLFPERARRDLPPDEYAVIHKTTCDAKPGALGYIVRSMEIAELRRLIGIPAPAHAAEQSCLPSTNENVSAVGRAL